MPPTPNLPKAMPATLPPPPHHPPSFFCVAKRKEGNKRKKERLLKQKLLKGCHQGQNVTALAILKRLEFKTFSGWPTMVADNTCQSSMTPPLWNPFRRPCIVEKTYYSKSKKTWCGQALQKCLKSRVIRCIQDFGKDFF